MEKFDYVILSENNEWLATGRQETQESLDDEIARLKEEDPEVELVVVQAKSFEMYNV